MVSGTWCPECHKLNKGRLALERNIDKKWLRLQTVAEERGGECLTGHWLGANQHHEFRCAKGHQWRTWANCIFQQ